MGTGGERKSTKVDFKETISQIRTPTPDARKQRRGGGVNVDRNNWQGTLEAACSDFLFVKQEQHWDTEEALKQTSKKLK